MTPYSKFPDREKSEFLVRVEQQPPLLHEAVVPLFIFADGLFDLFPVGCDVSPGGFQVGGRQRRVGRQDLGIGHTQTATVVQNPNRNARAMNAGVTALTISLLENPAGRRGHRSSSRSDQSLWNESDTIAMSPPFATAFDSKLVAVGGAMGASRCQGFGRFVGVGARCQALFLVFQLDHGPRSHGVRAERKPKKKLDPVKPRWVGDHPSLPGPEPNAVMESHTHWAVGQVDNSSGRVCV